jgi:hypothetical protein
VASIADHGSPIIGQGATVGKCACPDTGGSWLGAVATLEEPPGPSSPDARNRLEDLRRLADPRYSAEPKLGGQAPRSSTSATTSPQPRTPEPRWSRRHSA